MNAKIKISTLRLQAGRALAAAFVLVFASEAFAQTYTWIGPSGASWNTATDWSGGSAPGSGATVIDGYTGTTTSTLPAAGVTISSITSGSGGWTLFGPATTPNYSPTFTSINQASGGGMTFRDNTTDTAPEGYMTLNVSIINVSSGTLSLGSTSSSTTGDELDAIGTGTAPAVNMSGTTGTTTLALNVLTAYTLGVVNATGTGTNNIVLIDNSDATKGSMTNTATVTGLEGTGMLTIYAAGGSQGGQGTLNIANSSATTYTSSAKLEDATGSPAEGQLSVTVNLTGGGTQVLTGNNTYTGQTTITAGTLQIGNGGTTGTLGQTAGVGGNVVNNGTLAFDRATSAPTTAIGNAISGSGVVNFNSTVAQSIIGANSYSGGTGINSGTVYVNNTSASGLGTGTVTVASGATLGGSGTIALSSNPITMNGTLSPGGGLTVGTSVSDTGTTLTLGSGTTLAFGSGSAMAVTLGTSSTSVVFSGTAANSVTGLGNVTLNITEGAGFSAAQTYTILGNATTATAGSSYTVDAVDLNGTPLTAGTYTLVVDSSNDYTFEDSAVPEPADYALLLGAVVLGCAVLRRRRKQAYASSAGA